jgi:hypothetical protein
MRRRFLVSTAVVLTGLTSLATAGGAPSGVRPGAVTAPTFTASPLPPVTPAPTSPTPSGSTVLFAPTFPLKDGLVTNEYAYWKSTRTDAVRSPDWEMTSGSLFASSGYGWTGKLDRLSPDAQSTSATNSAVFRLNTRRHDFDRVVVRMSVRVNSLASTPAAFAPVAWDGVHIWLRYQSQYHLYYASVARRDGAVLIKKKCPGGIFNSGTYYTLTPVMKGYPIALGQWRDVAATVANNPDGSVRITLLVAGRYIVGANDKGVGCAPIRAPGSVGIRGDNANFHFTKFRVTRLP